MGKTQTQTQKQKEDKRSTADSNVTAHANANAPSDFKSLKSTIEGMWKQITRGVSEPVKTKFEATLSYFDKMHAVRSKRALTAGEQGVYDRARKVIIAQFEDMFERAEPAVNARRTMKREDDRHNHNNNSHNNKRTRNSKTSMHGGGETIWEMAMKFPIWVWDGLKAMITGILNFFGSVFSQKQKLFMDHFSPSRLLNMVGATQSNPNGAVVKLDGITAKLGESIEKLQRTVVGGVSGAATASMDMILNAFSMMPGIGTTLLIWRMFQNLLVIIGASLSVQAGQTEGSNAISDTINGNKSILNTAVVDAAASAETDTQNLLLNNTVNEDIEERNKVVIPTTAAAAPPAAGAAPTTTTTPTPTPTPTTAAGAAPTTTPKKGGGKATAANAVRASARALNQSLKRFSGMSTRVSSLLMTGSKKSNNGQKTPRNPLSFLASTSAAAASSLISGYALKPLSISRFTHA